MRQRVPWEVAQKCLNDLELHPGLGWDRSITKILALRDLNEHDTAAIMACLREHIICGEKLSRFYRLDVGSVDALREALVNAQITASDSAMAFPALLSAEELAREHEEPHLIAVERMPAGIAAIFSSARVTEIRESLDLQVVALSAPEIFSSYDDIVGVKLVRWQAFDVVWVPSEGEMVDVRIDFPRGMTQEAAAVANRHLVEGLGAIVGQDCLGDYINLFPLIERIYNDASEGRVVELGFGTTTASVKHERMRRRHLNLRGEDYHVAGKAGLKTPIEAFRLAVEWDIQENGTIAAQPEALFNGSARLTMTANPVLPDVIIRKCRGLTDYQFVRERIVNHLGEGL